VFSRVLVHLVDHAVEGWAKGPIGDAYRFVLLELDLHPRLVFGDIGAEEDRTHPLGSLSANRLVSLCPETPLPAAYSSSRARDRCPDPFLPARIRGETHPFDGAPSFPLKDLGDRFGRDHHPANPVFGSPKASHPSLDRLFHLALEPRVRVNDVPLEAIVCRWREPFRGARRDFRGPWFFLSVIDFSNFSFNIY